MEQPVVVRRRNPALPWFVAAIVSVLLALPVMVWDTFRTTPDWLAAGTIGVLGVGLICFVVGTALRARSQQVSTLRLVGRVLWAPIRFIFELLP